MRLSEFIQDTLFEIALGVERARVKARNHAAINPGSLNGERLTEKSYVDFDVSIVVGETQESGASGSGKLSGEIKVASIMKVGGDLGGGAQKSNALKAEQTHRVAFKVPVYLNADYRNNQAAQDEARELNID